jgi:hypothetical protein
VTSGNGSNTDPCIKAIWDGQLLPLINLGVCIPNTTNAICDLVYNDEILHLCLQKWIYLLLVSRDSGKNFNAKHCLNCIVESVLKNQFVLSVL